MKNRENTSDYEPEQPVGLALTLRIVTLLMVFIIVTHVVGTFGSDSYDWDLDHEMYFGQRLLNGDLIWTKEYHDKLPFLQFLFAVPAWFESIQVWRLMTLASSILAALSLPYLLPRLFDFPGMTKRNRHSLFVDMSLLAGHFH